MSDSDVDKLLGAVTWEPCHGRFFRGYPWHLYDDITDYLRYTLYDVIALDSCLRASIQAPKSLRDIFSQEMNVIADECAKVLHTLADSMRNMRKFSSDDILCSAEEAALALQNKIYIHTPLLLGRGAMESPRYSFYPESSQPDGDLWTVAATPVTGSVGREEHSKISPNEVLDNLSEQSNHSYKSSGKNVRIRCDENDASHSTVRHYSAPVQIPLQLDLDQHENSMGRSIVHDNCSLCSKEIEQTSNLSPRQAVSGLSHSICGHQPNQTSVEIDNKDKHGASVESHRHDFNFRVQIGASEFDQEEGNLSHSSKPPLPPVGWKKNFMQRRSSLGHNWEGTLERISALSPVKFASLLIEVVAKMKFIVNSVDELCQVARFQEIICPEDMDSVQ